MTITKEKIAAMLKAKLGLSSIVCAEIVNQIFDNIQEIIIDQKLTLKNFGSFYTNTKKPRPGINFHTKEKIIIPAKKVTGFLASSKLKAIINSDENDRLPVEIAPERVFDNTPKRSTGEYSCIGEDESLKSMNKSSLKTGLCGKSDEGN